MTIFVKILQIAGCVNMDAWAMWIIERWCDQNFFNFDLELHSGLFFYECGSPARVHANDPLRVSL